MAVTLLKACNNIKLHRKVVMYCRTTNTHFTYQSYLHTLQKTEWWNLFFHAILLMAWR